jgi:hypothetical protein
VQRIGVIGIGFKRLPATQLGIEMPPGAHMAKAGFMERSGRLRFLAGCPEIATFHRQISSGDVPTAR